MWGAPGFLAYHSSSLAERSLCRHTPKVGAVCGKAARTVLCGGRAMKRASLPLQRRAFIAGLGSAAAWPLVALTGATAAKSFTIGYLTLLPDEDRMSFMARFMRRLAELGYNDGQNLRLVYRSAGATWPL